MTQTCNYLFLECGSLPPTITKVLGKSRFVSAAAVSEFSPPPNTLAAGWFLSAPSGRKFLHRLQCQNSSDFYFVELMSVLESSNCYMMGYVASCTISPNEAFIEGLDDS